MLFLESLSSIKIIKMIIKERLFKKLLFSSFNEFRNADSSNVIILFLLSLLFFHSIFFKPDHIIYSDYSDVIAQHISWKSLINSNGQFSLWDPYTFSGSPAFANPQSMFVYPLNFLFYQLPIEQAFGYTFLLHVFLSGLFMFFWVRCLKLSRETALITSSIYMLNTTFILKIHAGWISMYPVIMMIPLFFNLLEKIIRKKRFVDVIYMGLAFGLTFYTANYQLLLYTICFLFLYLLLRVCFFTNLYFDSIYENNNRQEPYKRIKRFLILNIKFLGSILVGIMLASYQMFPVHELSGLSTRDFVSSEYYSLSTLKWDSFFTILSPEIFGSLKNNINSGNELWENCFFVGIAGIYFIGIGFCYKRKGEIYLFLTLTLLVFFYAMSQSVQKFFFHFFPFFKYFMQPERIIPLFVFFAISMAGIGLELFFDKEKKNKIKNYIISIYLFSALLICFSIPPFNIFFSKNVFATNFLPTAFLFILYNTVCFINFKKRIQPTLLKTSTFIIVISELFFYGMKYIDTRKTEEAFPLMGVTEYLKQDSSTFRVLLAGRTTIPYGQAGYYKIQIVNGYNPLNISRYVEFANMAAGKTDVLPTKWLDFNGVQKMALLDFLNVKYIVTNKPIENSPQLKLIFKEDVNIFHFYEGIKKVPLYLYENTNFLPRVYIVNKVETAKGSSENIKKALANQNFYTTAVIEEKVPSQYRELAVSNNISLQNKKKVFVKEVKITSYEHDEIELKVSLNKMGFMVLSDTYYPGWELWDNGKMVDIYRTNYAFRGAFLETGNHDLTFKFNPKSYKKGAIISLVSGILLLIFLIGYHIIKRSYKKI